MGLGLDVLDNSVRLDNESLLDTLSVIGSETVVQEDNDVTTCVDIAAMSQLFQTRTPQLRKGTATEWLQ
jgi:hypothetical protein